jgi:hypothetical protein
MANALADAFAELGTDFQLRKRCLMRLYECEQCKAVNRVPSIRLDKQPVCGACGREIEDFPFCRMVRLAWKHKELAPVVVGLIGLAAVSGLDWSTGSPGSKKITGPMTPTSHGKNSSAAPDSACEAQALRQGVYRLYGGYKDIGRPARLTIRTPSGSNYFVKLESVLDHSRVISFLVLGGRTLEAHVPLGTFTLKYASGSTWCGEGDLFGRDTMVFKANDTFTFEVSPAPDGYSIRGWTIELIPQRLGNLQTIPISRSEF